MSALPVLIVGAGPIGLTTALGLAFYKIPFRIFEDDRELSRDTKAGTTLTRTLEVFRRYGVADAVLARALRVEEIGDIDLATNSRARSVRTALLANDTRYPFVINLPQHHLEPILADALTQSEWGALSMQHKLVGFTQLEDRVVAELMTPSGSMRVEGSYLLACDGGRSSVRTQLGIGVGGHTLDARVMLVDLKIDLDVTNPRDYPYLAYFKDAEEWMILVRHPHCWRFLFPLEQGAPEPSDGELRAKVLRFIGEATDVELIGKVIYPVHHRVAERWRSRRVFLMGDAAHLITPMWALGLNSGVLDASNLPWRLAWVLRGWANDALLDGYAREQQPLAQHGAGEMAEAARKYMEKRAGTVSAMTDNDWGNAYTRALLAVRLDVNGTGDWSMIKSEASPPLAAGDRIPDWTLHGPSGRPLRLHDLIDGNFLALYFTDVRRKPNVPANDSPELKHYAVSRWDAPLDSGLRDRSLLDVGELFLHRTGCAPNTLILVRPDDHIAAIVPMQAHRAEDLYRTIVEGSAQ